MEDGMYVPYFCACSVQAGTYGVQYAATSHIENACDPGISQQFRKRDEDEPSVYQVADDFQSGVLIDACDGKPIPVAVMTATIPNSTQPGAPLGKKVDKECI